MEREGEQGLVHGVPALLDLHQLDRFPAGPSIMTARVSPSAVGLLQERDALGAQLGDPGVEIGDAERDVVVQLPARGRERRVALAHVPRQHDVAEGDGGGRRAEHALARERRPGAVGSALDLAVLLGARRRGAAPRAPARR